MHRTVSLGIQLPNIENGSELSAVSLNCSGLRYGLQEKSVPALGLFPANTCEKVLICVFFSPSSPSTLAHLKTFEIDTSPFKVLAVVVSDAGVPPLTSWICVVLHW